MYENNSLFTRIREINSDDELIYMQYTGINDKNGVEIYEGDIVLFTDNIKIKGSTSHISVIEWREELSGFHFHTDCIGCYTINHSQVTKYDVEVIGNIYENPELVTEVN